jgi:3-oxoacyl-[acyl-carrier-protein] synthase II
MSLMTPTQEIAITGVGVICPIGIGKAAYWAALCGGRSGVRRLDGFGDDASAAVSFGGTVADFDPKQFVRPRKSLKVMSRDIQLAAAAADMACADGQLRDRPVDPDRLGVLFAADMMTCELADMINVYRSCLVEGRFEYSRWGPAAMAEVFPLWMLKYLPNMLACHVAIAQDARGPSNSVVLGDVSSLAAVAEAVGILRRGQADVMIVGGGSSRLHPATLVRAAILPSSHRSDDPAAASRPFDARRDGMVYGEGAAALLLETSAHAAARGVKIQGRILAAAATFEPHRRGQPLEGCAIRRAIADALRAADLPPQAVGHVNAHGASTPNDDRIEAQAIRATLGDTPVTAPKGSFGNLGAGSGAVELVASVLALQHGLVPPTLNYQFPDPDCPVNVVHGRPLEVKQATAVALNHAPCGQAMAVVLAGGD